MSGGVHLLATPRERLLALQLQIRRVGPELSAETAEMWVSGICSRPGVFQAFDASGDSCGTRPVYNAAGYVSQLKKSREGTAGLVYWTVQAMNAPRQVTSALVGNGTHTIR